MCKTFEGCGIFIKRDIQPRSISAKVQLSLLATCDQMVGENDANWPYMTSDPYI